MMKRAIRLLKQTTAGVSALALIFAVGCQSSPEPEPDDSMNAPPQETTQESPEYESTQEPAPAESGMNEPGMAAPAPATDAPTGSDDVSDDEVDRFANAYVAVMNIQMEYEPKVQAAADANEIAELQTAAQNEVIVAVESQDMTVDEFNAIAQLLATDEELRMRVQERVDTLAN